MQFPSVPAAQPAAIPSAQPGAGQPAVAQPGLLAVPPLPASATLDPSLAAGASPWLDAYVAYASTVCPMLPPAFHESAALWLAGVAVARRLYVSLAGRTLYPNLFVAWLVPNQPYDAVAAFDLVRGLAERAFPGLLAPSHMRPLDLLFLFARCLGNHPADRRRSYYSNQQDERFPAQRGWLVDDLACLLSGSHPAFQRSGLGLLVAFYRCHPRYRYAAGGLGFLTAPDTYLSLLTCATPATLAGSLSAPALWELGWWPSFALVTPEPGHPAWQEPAPSPEPPELLRTVVTLFKKLPGTGHPDHYRPCQVTLAPDAAGACLAYRRALVRDFLTPDLDARLWSAYSQFPLQLIKVATLLAALDWAAALPPDPPPPSAQPHSHQARGRDLLFTFPPAQPRPAPKPRYRAGLWALGPPHPDPATTPPTLTLAHLARAQAIVEAWRHSLHRALAAALSTASCDLVDSSGALDARILRQVEKHEPAGATTRDVYRYLPDRKPAEIAARLAQLVTLGLVETIPGPDLPGRGGPTLYYRLAR